MTGVEACPICTDNFIVNNKKIKCGFCQEVFHNMCAKVKDSMVKSIAECINVLWFCNNCLCTVKQNLKLIEQMKSVEKKADTIIKQSSDCLEAIHSIQKLNLDDIKTNTNQDRGRNYARALKEGVVVVKPTKACESKDTKLKIRENVSMSDLGVGITDMRDARQGAVVIKCKDMADANKLKLNLQQQLGQNYLTTIPQKKNPRIKIVGIEKEYTEDELRRVLKLQNKDILEEGSLIKLVVTKKMVKTFLAIIECDAKSFQNILTKAEGRLFVDYRACRCYEYVSIIKCYNCNQYNHTSKECPNSKTCGKCASIHHESKDCSSRTYSCINCKLSNDKFKLHLNTDHSAYNIECPTYIRHLNSERAKIQYREDFSQ